ncbi:MAG: hypothetical protein LUE88_02425 [Clostridiales bacterium]|nr:hypothetical protein [Clostridiales bacterium]
MAENSTDNMMKNIDRIKSLSKLMSMDGGEVDTDKLMNAITAAKSLGMFQNNEVQDAEFEERDEYITPEDGQSESLRVIKAAIPFLDREYQKNLFLAVKLMEMSREFDNGSMSLQCQSIREGSDEKQMEAMLRAVRGQLSYENGRRLDVILKMMEARRLASALKEIQ